jgi:hypothetical protein
VKTDGGLSFVTGPMGSGKTLFEVRGGVNIMLRGGWWITNVPLYPDALDRIARHVAPTSRKKRRELAARLVDRYIYTEDLREALTHGVHEGARWRGEARARLGWDESYSELNAREWDGGRGKSKDDRAELLEWVPMLRKLNVHGYLLAQHEETVDKNMRRICNYVVRLDNRRESARIMGLRVKCVPPLFIAQYYQANQAEKRGGIARPAFTERHLLSWHRKLYDTHGLYGSAADKADAGEITWLGVPRLELEAATQERTGLAGAST